MPQKSQHFLNLYAEGAMHSFALHGISQLVCDKLMLPPEFKIPSWLPGFLSYFSLLAINALLPLIAIITVDDVVTGLEIALVTFSLLASVILLAMLIYKTLMRSCVFNDAKRDKNILFCVTGLDFCAAVGWSIRLDRKAGFCSKPERCHTVLIVLGVVLAWSSVVISLCAAMCANHGRKRRPSPLQLHSSRPAISSPVIVHAGQFAEEDNKKFGGFTDIPLEKLGAEDEDPWNPL